jgi:hypothetical protein
MYPAVHQQQVWYRIRIRGWPLRAQSSGAQPTERKRARTAEELSA